MNHEQRNAFIEKEFEENIMAICKTKGKEYSNSTEDANANFHKLARELNMDPKQILWVYAQKHNQAISNFLKEGVSHSNESIEGRIHDAILYHFILLSLLQEEKDLEKQDSCPDNKGENKPPRQRKFKVGDKIEVIDRYTGAGHKDMMHIGTIGEITEIEGNSKGKLYWIDGDFAIRFEDGDIIELVK